MKKRALISVFDKTNLETILKKLKDYELISTGNTAEIIKNLGYDVKKVEEITNSKEILGGRVKTLHPGIHGGILSRRTEQDNEELLANNIQNIDVVICNLYPFEKVIQKKEVTLEEAIENIDIGGVTLLRAAAKNYQHVTVIADVNAYDSFEETLEYRQKMAYQAFAIVTQYDISIANFLNQKFELKDEENLLIGAKKNSELRYGENSHQKATLYLDNSGDGYSIDKMKQLNGKELSYNNLRDIEVALNIIGEFSTPTVVAIKHNTPCGVGKADNLLDAFFKCLKADDISIFGGIVIFNGEVTLPVAEELNKLFLEVIIAPSYTKEALELLQKKKNLRVLEIPMNERKNQQEIMSINGGYLVQNKDQKLVEEEEMNVVTTNKPEVETIEDLKFIQQVCKHIKSNAIVVAYKDQIIGIGGGQTSRIDSAEIALKKAKEKGYEKDLILASDAFFPFKDVIELANTYGVKDIIQVGGSIKDQEVIDACNELGISMIMTGVRHFKH